MKKFYIKLKSTTNGVEDNDIIVKADTKDDAREIAYTKCSSYHRVGSIQTYDELFPQRS